MNELDPPVEGMRDVMPEHTQETHADSIWEEIPDELPADVLDTIMEALREHLDPEDRDTPPPPRLQLTTSGRTPIVPPLKTGTGMFDRGPAPPRVDILVATSVPDRVESWATCFACDSAEEVGPTALIRLEPRVCIVEIHGWTDSMPEPPASVFDQVESAISWFSMFTQRTIVVPGAHETPETYCPWDAPIHLMSGSNQVALADTMNHLVSILDFAHVHTLTPPVLDVLLIDSHPERTDTVVDRLQDAARVLKGEGLKLGGIVERKPIHSSKILKRFSIPAHFGCRDVLETLECPYRESINHQADTGYR